MNVHVVSGHQYQSLQISHIKLPFFKKLYRGHFFVIFLSHYGYWAPVKFYPCIIFNIQIINKLLGKSSVLILKIRTISILDIHCTVLIGCFSSLNNKIILKLESVIPIRSDCYCIQYIQRHSVMNHCDKTYYSSSHTMY